MDITPVVPADRQVIQSYGGGGFRITGARHAGSVLVFPGRTLAWPVTAIEAATADSLAEVFAGASKVELLLIGTGARMVAVPAALRAHFRAAGVALDAMDTGAACRTYNVLMSEERRIAAALIAIS